MRKLAGLLIILAVLILGGYYFTGYITENSVKQTFSYLNRIKGLHTNVKTYNRGWFTSTADVELKYKMPQQIIKGNAGTTQTIPEAVYTLLVPLKVHHGPVIFAGDGSVHFGLGYGYTLLNLPTQVKKQLQLMVTEQSKMPKLSLSIFVNYLNSKYVSFGVPAFTLYAKEDGGTFEWQGMVSTTSISSNMDNIDGTFNIKGLQIAKDKAELKMGSFVTEYDLHQASNGLMLGTASIEFPMLILNSDGKKIFEIDDVSIKSSNDIEDNLFNASISASVDKIYSDGKNYGPGKFVMSLKNIDADVLAKINAQATSVRDGSDEERKRVFFAMLPELPKLFTQGAEFNISELTFTMPQGAIDGHMKLALPKVDTTNPFQMIQKIRGNGKISIPADVLKMTLVQTAKENLAKKPDLQQAIIRQMQQNSNTGAASNSTQTSADAADASTQTEQTTQQSSVDLDQMAEAQAKQDLAKMVQTGMIVKQGSSYVIEFNLEKGKLTINGKPFNPAMLFSNG